MPRRLARDDEDSPDALDAARRRELDLADQIEREMRRPTLPQRSPPSRWMPPPEPEMDLP